MNYLINILLAAALFIGFQVSQADPQISIEDGGNYCHAPWDATNTDNEWKLTCAGFINEDDDNQTAYGFSTETKYFPAGAVEGSRISYQDTVDGGDATDCTLTNNDGDTYASTDWMVEVRVDGLKKVTFTVECLDAQAN